MTRHRTVYPTAQVAHIWANLNSRDIDYARNASDSVSFENRRFYSYLTPVAHIMRSPLGVEVALVSSVTYSMTTNSKHLNAVRRALRESESLVSFTVPYIDIAPRGHYQPLTFLTGNSQLDDMELRLKQMHVANLLYLVKQYEGEYDRFMRMPSSHVPTAHFVAEALLRTSRMADRYASLWGLPFVPPNIDQHVVDVMDRRERLMNSPKGKANRAQRETRKRLQEERAHRIQVERVLYNREQFRLGAPNNNMLVNGNDGGVMLRLSTDRKYVETSWGAMAPIDDVCKVMETYARVREMHPSVDIDLYHEGMCEPFAAQLGEFRLDVIYADGNIRAGCHVITANEIQLLRQCLAAEGML